MALNLGVFIATAGAAAVAWWQAIEASNSRRDAAKSEAAALEARQHASKALAEANLLSGVAMRAPLATALSQYASQLVSARMRDGKLTAAAQLKLLQDHNPSITSAGFASGQDTMRLTSWVSAFTSTGLAGQNVIAELRIVDDRLLRWVQDPDGVMAEIAVDPGSI